MQSPIAYLRKGTLAGLALGLVAAGLSASAAHGAEASQRFVIVATTSDGRGRVVATGPVTGVGTETLTSHVENPDGSFTDTDVFDLPLGTVQLTDTYRATFDSDPRSCTTRIGVSGSYTITGGTGAFAGASGLGTFTASGIFVASRDANGGCLGFDAPPQAFVQVVRDTGTTILP